jgi:hypothetical protein
VLGRSGAAIKRNTDLDTFIRDYYKFPAHLKWWIVNRDNEDFTKPAFGEIKQPGEWFSVEEAPLVEKLTIITDTTSLDTDNAAAFSVLQNLGAFTNLKFLCIPLDALEFLDLDSIAPNIEYLRLSRPRTFEWHEKGMARQLLLPENRFPKLKSLYLYFPPSCYRNFNIGNFPELQWVELDLELEKTAKSLKLFKGLPKMQGFSLNGVYKKDILDALEPSIIALDFWNIRTKSLDLSLLTRFQNLRYLTIRGPADLDAAVLSGLKHLSELELYRPRSLSHADALLNLPFLERVSIRHIVTDSLSLDLQEALKARCSYAEFE